MTFSKLTFVNGLTIGRAFAVIPVVGGIVVGGHWAILLALVLFLLAGVTDYIDGWLARRWSVTNRFGAALDPVADKIVVLGALVALGLTVQHPWYMSSMVLIILIRELTISGFREGLSVGGSNLKQDLVLPVQPLAKVKTFAQFIAVAVLLADRLASVWPKPSIIDVTISNLAAGNMATPETSDILANSLHIVGFGALGIATVLTIWTGASYLQFIVKNIR